MRKLLPRLCIAATGPLLVAFSLAALARSPRDDDGGKTELLETPGGRLVGRTFESSSAGAHPLLIVVLHGDAPFNKPDYQYVFAKRAASQGEVVAAAILRPGYSDPLGNTSAGERGQTTGDNYTPDRIEMIAAAIQRLKDEYHPRTTLIVGHSGGSAIAADIIALHPDLAGAALLVSCPCDVPGWRVHMKEVIPSPLWDQPVDSVSPLAVAQRIPQSDRIRLIVGEDDPITLPRFTQAYGRLLSNRGIDVQITVLPKLGHEILLQPDVLTSLRQFVDVLSRPN